MLQGSSLKHAVKEALLKTEELLRIGWCKTWALNKEGKSVKPESEEACKWCLEGALIAATYYHEEEDAKQIREYCVALIQTANKEFIPATISNQTSATRIHELSLIPTLNDRRASTQEEVISWVVKARKLAERAKWQ